MKNARLNSFLPILSLDKAKEFYIEKLGLVLIQDNGFALEVKSGSSILRLTLVKEFIPHPFTVLGWEVDDIRAQILELKDRGIHFERFPEVIQDDHSVWSAPGGALVAWFKDPFENLLSLSQHEF